jgi:hypothetical protein
MLMNKMRDKDSFVRQLFLIIATSMQTLVWATLVSNFGWTHTISIASYVLSALIYYVVYIVWTNKLN